MMPRISHRIPPLDFFLPLSRTVSLCLSRWRANLHYYLAAARDVVVTIPQLFFGYFVWKRARKPPRFLSVRAAVRPGTRTKKHAIAAAKPGYREPWTADAVSALTREPRFERPFGRARPSPALLVSAPSLFAVTYSCRAPPIRQRGKSAACRGRVAKWGWDIRGKCKLFLFLSSLLIINLSQSFSLFLSLTRRTPKWEQQLLLSTML